MHAFMSSSSNEHSTASTWHHMLLKQVSLFYKNTKIFLVAYIKPQKKCVRVKKIIITAQPSS